MGYEKRTDAGEPTGMGTRHFVAKIIAGRTAWSDVMLETRSANWEAVTIATDLRVS